MPCTRPTAGFLLQYEYALAHLHPPWVLYRQVTIKHLREGVINPFNVPGISQHKLLDSLLVCSKQTKVCLPQKIRNDGGIFFSIKYTLMYICLLYINNELQTNIMSDVSHS